MMRGKMAEVHRRFVKGDDPVKMSRETTANRVLANCSILAGKVEAARTILPLPYTPSHPTPIPPYPSPPLTTLQCHPFIAQQFETNNKVNKQPERSDEFADDLKMGGVRRRDRIGGFGRVPIMREREAIRSPDVK